MSYLLKTYHNKIPTTYHFANPSLRLQPRMDEVLTNQKIKKINELKTNKMIMVSFNLTIGPFLHSKPSVFLNKREIKPGKENPRSHQRGIKTTGDS